MRRGRLDSRIRPMAVGEIQSQNNDLATPSPLAVGETRVKDWTTIPIQNLAKFLSTFRQ